MELFDLEKRAFLYALKAIYFDQGGAVSSALDYYVAAGETLLEAKPPIAVLNYQT